jgi:hypothetical protein
MLDSSSSTTAIALRWGEFRERRPDLADAGRAILYQFGLGLAFLGTIRPTGAPRVHPIAPLLHQDGLYGFLVPSPKLQDLRRDPRYALHSYPRPDDEDAFYITGQAVVTSDASLLDNLLEAYVAERTTRPPDLDEQTVVEFLIATCLLTRTTGHGDFEPRHTIWRI